jgi:hypothetical protein
MNNETSRFGHSTRNGENQSQVFNSGGISPFDGRATKSKDENRVFDLGHNLRLAAFTSMADTGKVALCLQSQTWMWTTNRD